MRHKLVILLVVVLLSIPTAAHPAIAQTCTPGMSFVADVTIPDDTTMKPNESFEKVWRLKNSGTCDWSVKCSLVFVSGDSLGATATQPLTTTVASGETVDIAVKMQAPAKEGTYTSSWQLQDELGEPVGNKVYVRIAVKASAAPEPAVAPTSSEITGDFWDDFSAPTTAGIPDKEDRWGAVYHQAGQLHVVAKKAMKDDSEWHQYFGVARFYPSHYGDMSLTVDMGRVSGEGFGGGQGSVIFGYRDDNNYYSFSLLRSGKLWMLSKVINGKTQNLAPGGALDNWDKAAVVHDAAIPAGDAWDRVKVVVERQNEGTWIGCYANDILLGQVVDHDYPGGAFGLDCFTYGNEAHVVFDDLHVAPTGKH